MLEARLERVAIALRVREVNFALSGCVERWIVLVIDKLSLGDTEKKRRTEIVDGGSHDYEPTEEGNGKRSRLEELAPVRVAPHAFKRKSGDYGATENQVTYAIQLSAFVLWPLETFESASFNLARFVDVMMRDVFLE